MKEDGGSLLSTKFRYCCRIEVVCDFDAKNLGIQTLILISGLRMYFVVNAADHRLPYCCIRSI